MATKKNADSEFVSSEPHEIKTVCKLFTDDNGDYLPGYTAHLIHHHMSLGGKRKVLRTAYYKSLKDIGFKK
jgi:hypothetical protein